MLLATVLAALATLLSSPRPSFAQGNSESVTVNGEKNFSYKYDLTSLNCPVEEFLAAQRSAVAAIDASKRRMAYVWTDTIDQEALRQLTEVVAVLGRCGKGDGKETFLAQPYEWIGTALYIDGKYDDSIPYYEKVNAINRNALNYWRAQTARTSLNLSYPYIDQSEYSKALQLLDEAWTLYEATSDGADTNTKMKILNLKAYCHFNLKRHVEAIATLRASEKLNDADPIALRAELANTYLYLYFCYEQTGDQKKARSYLDRSEAEFLKRSPRDEEALQRIEKYKKKLEKEESKEN
ncbi:MAG: tetratricopeptide repeat protein [Deltaproteobacteria bacterium]|nr:tetratricopeptide repeat protein [Deltaproteobacteria bacterium]